MRARTAGEGNVETMLSIDKGLQEITFVKVLCISFNLAFIHTDFS
jgi:hypothetical protein